MDDLENEYYMMHEQKQLEAIASTVADATTKRDCSAMPRRRGSGAWSRRRSGARPLVLRQALGRQGRVCSGGGVLQAMC
eukprot:16094877-Heterocapsa_arctica.AAC.1